MAIGRTSFSGIIAAFWLIFWSVRILVDYDRMITYEQGRVFLALYFLALVLGLLFFGYLLLKKHAPKMMYKVNRESRCPDCFVKLKGATDFCPKCGKDLTERSESRFCWNCGYEDGVHRHHCGILAHILVRQDPGGFRQNDYL